MIGWIGSVGSAATTDGLKGRNMIRVIYHWTVTQGQEEAFAAAWHAITLTLRERVAGCHGSLLLRDAGSPQEFVAIARWTSRAAWQAFHDAPLRDAALAEHSATMRTAADKPRTQVFYEELDELTVTDAS